MKLIEQATLAYEINLFFIYIPLDSNLTGIYFSFLTNNFVFYKSVTFNILQIQLNIYVFASIFYVF
jgi:hypothetical protein